MPAAVLWQAGNLMVSVQGWSSLWGCLVLPEALEEAGIGARGPGRQMAASASTTMAYRVSVPRKEGQALTLERMERDDFKFSNVMKLKDQTSPAQREEKILSVHLWGGERTLVRAPPIALGLCGRLDFQLEIYTQVSSFRCELFLQSSQGSLVQSLCMPVSPWDYPHLCSVWNRHLGGECVSVFCFV